MKNLLIALLLFASFAVKSQTLPTISVFKTISDLQGQVGFNDAIGYVIGGTTTTDFRGAFYKWDASSIEAQDMTYYNVIQVTGVTTGRWIRTNQSSTALPQGMLFRIGPLKILAANGVTSASGEFTLNATIENTAGGTAIFSSILFNSTMATTGSATPNDAVNGTVKSVSSGNKQIVYRYTKGNTIGILGALAIVAAGANVPVQCFVVGL